MKLLFLMLAISLPQISKAELICSGGDGFQQCSNEQTVDPSSCAENDPILEHTGQVNQPFICNNQTLAGSGKTSDEIDQEKKEYEKLCKKKAKAYKKALMKNLFSKGKVGQWMQVLFHKKKYKADPTNLKAKDRNQTLDINPEIIKNMSPEQVEDYILSELEKNLKMPGLKERAKSIPADPAYKLSYDKPETVPLNLMISTKKGTSCKVETESIPKEDPFKAKDCKFCVEKNITGSFTNDCSYMVNSQHSEAEAHKMLGVKNRGDYCNHSMDGEENDLKEVDSMAETLCEMAHDGTMKPDFKIETSRNLYKDKTPQLAAKRGEYIQKYIRKTLTEKCFGGDLEEAPDWLKDESEFNSAVKVTHPYYEGGKEGDYGPSPYASTKEEQDLNVKNLTTTLAKEKSDLQAKSTTVSAAKTKESETITKMDKDIVTKSAAYQKLSKEISSIKSLDENFYLKKKQLEDVYNEVRTLQEQKKVVFQKISDLDKELGGYKQKLSTIDGDNSKKVTLLNEFYSEKNEKGTVDTKAWDEKLFNGFKMVRITGKAVEDHDTIVPPEYMTPAVKVALNALVDMEDFTCVVEPIATHKTTIGGVLRGVGRVGMAITLPVVAAGGLALGLATSPLSWAASYMCSGCGDPGSVPPVFTFNPRFWNLKAPFKKETWKEVGRGMNSYVTLGGHLEAGAKLKKNNFANETEDVRAEELERLAKKNKNENE